MTPHAPRVRCTDFYVALGVLQGVTGCDWVVVLRSTSSIEVFVFATHRKTYNSKGRSAIPMTPHAPRVRCTDFYVALGVLQFTKSHRV